MTLAYQYIRTVQKGISGAPYYPYKGSDSQSCTYNSKYSVANLTDYVKVQSGSEETLKRALASIGPLAVAIDSSVKTFQGYASGVYNDPNCTNPVNHAVTLVGYGTDTRFGDYWLVKNQWGKSWGRYGYVQIARNMGGLCGITTDISYPIV